MEQLYEKGTGCFVTRSIREDVSIDFAFSRPTYSGLFISSPDRAAQDEELFIGNHIKKFKRLAGDCPVQVIRSYQERYPKVLKTRACMVQLTTDESSHLGVIWFDDGKKDIYDSLNDIYNDIDWPLAEEFEQ